MSLRFAPLAMQMAEAHGSRFLSSADARRGCHDPGQMRFVGRESAWRKRMGIEPTGPVESTRPRRF